MAATHRGMVDGWPDHKVRTDAWALARGQERLDAGAERRLIRHVAAGRRAAARLAADRDGHGARRPTPARRRALAALVARGRAARDRLVADHLPLVAMIADRYARLGVEAEDLRQEGTLGLLTGLDRFDPARPVRVATYVRWWIRAAIGEALARRFPVTLPRHVQRAARAHCQAGLAATALPAPADDEAGGVQVPASVTPATLRCALDAMRPALRLDDLVTASDDGDSAASATDVPDPWAGATLDAVIDDVLVLPGASNPAVLLDDIVSPRSRRILELRYGFDGAPRSRREVAVEIGLSAERVRQLEVAALATLQTAVALPMTEPPV